MKNILTFASCMLQATLAIIVLPLWWLFKLAACAAVFLSPVVLGELLCQLAGI